MSLINKTLLMSGVDYFDDQATINPFMDNQVKIDITKAKLEHESIKKALENVGVKVIKIDPPKDCQDGVYTANWGLEKNGVVVLARLPNARKKEESYAKSVFESLGKRVVEVPGSYKFSGQGDALPCGNYLFCGSGYRSDPKAQEFASKALGFKRIQLQTIPKLDDDNQPFINISSGWPDSYFYDLDLALSILKPPLDNQKGLIAYCPEAFMPESREKLASFDKVDKIEVSFQEAKEAFACNLVATGKTVIMSDKAPGLKSAIESHGLKIITLSCPELAKGGGFIRCTSLCLSNS